MVKGLLFRARTFGALVLIATILSCIFTAPVILHLSTKVAGDGADLFQSIAAVQERVSSIEARGSIKTIISSAAQLRFDPIQLNAYWVLFFGFPLGYNLFWLFSFIASWVGMYYLAKLLLTSDFPKNRNLYFSAAIAATIFTFAPMRLFWSQGFYGTMHTEWIVWTLYFLLLNISKLTVPRFIALAASAMLLVQTEYHFAVFFLLLLPVLGWYYRHQLYQLIRRPRSWAFIAVAIAGAIALFSREFSGLFHIASSDNNYLNVGINSVSNHSNDLLSFLIPPYNQTLWGDFFSEARSSFQGNAFKSPAYLGIIVLSLSSIALFSRKSRNGRFWAWIGAGFSILSLGPFLHIGGLIEPKIPLPYLLLYKYFPYIENIRSVNRITIFAIVGVAIASSFGLLMLLRHVRKTIWQVLLPVLFLVGITLEYWTVPYPTTTPSVPPFFEQLASDSEKYSLIEIPGATNYNLASRSLYYRTIHKKNVINSFQFSRNNPNDPAFLQTTSYPILNELLLLQPKNASRMNHRAIDVRDRAANMSAMENLNARYILLYKEFQGGGPEDIEPKDFTNIQQFILSSLSAKKVFEDDIFIAYELQAETPRAPFLLYNEGWREPLLETQNAFQWIDQEARVTLEAPNYSRDVDLSFIAKAPRTTNQLLEVTFDDEPVGNFYLLTTELPIRIRLPSFKQGAHSIRFRVSEAGSGKNSLIDPTVALGNLRISTASTQDNQIPEALSTSLQTLELPYRSVNQRLAGCSSNPIEPSKIIDRLLEDYYPGSGFADALNKILLPNAITPIRLRSQRDIFSNIYYKNELRSVLQEGNIEAISFRTDLLSNEEKRLFLNDLEGIGKLTFVAKNSRCELYKIEYEDQSPVPLMSRRGEWRRLRNRGEDSQRRALRQGSSLELQALKQSTSSSKLSATVQSCSNEPRIIRFSLNGVASFEWRVLTSKPKDYFSIFNPGFGQQTISISVWNDEGRELSEAELLACPILLQNLSVESL